MKGILSRTIPVLMLLNGIFFASNIYVIGNTRAAIAMHNDLAPAASPLMAQSKVLVCFISGLLYVLAFVGYVRGAKRLVLAGFFSAAIFVGLYIIELFCWGRSYPRVWLDFSIFGGLSTVYGIWCFRRAGSLARRS